MSEKLKDQFGMVVESGKIYGMSDPKSPHGERRSALIPYEVGFDDERGEEVIRRYGSKDPWSVLYCQDFVAPKFCVELNSDLSEKLVDDAELSNDLLIDAHMSRVGLLRSELHRIESQLCKMAGVEVDDQTDISEAVFRMVWDGCEESCELVKSALSPWDVAAA